MLILKKSLLVDRKLIEDFNEDGETLYDEDNDEIEEEMEIEEDDN